MNKGQYIIADSGGTGTQWGYVVDGKLVHLINGKSFHPKFHSQWDIEEVKMKLIHKGIPLFTPIFFYGAGCGSDETVELTREYFKNEGLTVMDVQSDALGACRAVCGNNDGYVAILGTGSILMEFKEGKISQRFGGFGSLLGDEGSGFHFGKLLVKGWLQKDERLLKNKELLTQILGTPEQVMSRINQPDLIQWLPQLAKEIPMELVIDFHRSNAEQFMDAYLPKNNVENRLLHVIGSYGLNIQSVISNELEKRYWKLGNCFASPMTGLVNHHNNLI